MVNLEVGGSARQRLNPYPPHHPLLLRLVISSCNPKVATYIKILSSSLTHLRGDTYSLIYIIYIRKSMIYQEILKWLYELFGIFAFF